VYVPAKAFLDVFGHRVRSFRFAVSQKGAAGDARLHSLQPLQHFLPVSVRGEAANLRHTATNRHPLAQYFHFRFAVLNAPSSRASCLEPDENDGRFGIRNHPQRVVQYATAGHHSRRTDDHARSLSVIQFLRLLPR
jgi:hypothetical protein